MTGRGPIPEGGGGEIVNDLPDVLTLHCKSLQLILLSLSKDMSPRSIVASNNAECCITDGAHQYGRIGARALAPACLNDSDAAVAE